ncbi:MAG: HAMP domain-containing protein [Chloroflexi bacterium]|nr:HAMP domain-containing protein [Chloroflexota bacterium]MBU1749144.1 HAMP domain-containing protein [Chloroflexota bacterium]
MSALPAAESNRADRPGRLRRWFTLRLRPKLIIPYVLLAIAVVVAGAYFIAQTMAGSLQARFDQQLHDSGVQASDGIVEAERSQLGTLRAIAHTEGLPQAVQQGDAAAVQSVVLPLTYNTGADCVDVVSRSGAGLFTMHRRSDASELAYRLDETADYGAWSLVRRILAGETDKLGDKFANLVHTDWGDVLYVAGPIKADGELVGVVLVGTYLDQLALHLDELALARVTLYDREGRVLATSMGARDPASTNLDPAQAQAILADQDTLVHRRPLTVGSVDYTEVLAPLQVRSGQDLGVLSVALSRNLVVLASEPLRQWLLVLLGTALAAIIIIGLVLGARITRPLLELVQATRQVSEGNLDALVPVRSEDEIGTLARAFNGMVQGLREREFIKDAFGRLVTREVREQILSGEVSLHGEKRVVTTLFTDIREFTRLSERFDPTVVVQFLNEYFTVIVEAVELYGGTVNKFGGDSTLVIFGAPQHQSDHACRTIQASLEIRQRLGELNARRIARGDVPIHTGIGINTGEVVAGTIGSEQRMEYTVIGDAVNISARIQGLTKDFVGHDILLSQSTYEALGPDHTLFRFQNLGQAAIRGKREPATLYALIDRAVNAPCQTNQAPDIAPDAPAEEVGHES